MLAWKEIRATLSYMGGHTGIHFVSFLYFLSEILLHQSQLILALFYISFGGDKSIAILHERPYGHPIHPFLECAF